MSDEELPNRIASFHCAQQRKQKRVYDWMDPGAVFHPWKSPPGYVKNIREDLDENREPTPLTIFALQQKHIPPPIDNEFNKVHPEKSSCSSCYLFPGGVTSKTSKTKKKQKKHILPSPPDACRLKKKQHWIIGNPLNDLGSDLAIMVTNKNAKM